MIEYVPSQLFDVSSVPNINIDGRGGKEQQLTSILSAWKRVNAPLYDFEYNSDKCKYFIEVKKQSNLQWFDSGKYHELSRAELQIVLMFIMHDKGSITNISLINIDNFLHWQKQHNSIQGWDANVIRIGHELKKSHPTLQFKAPAHIRTMLNQAPELFQRLYNKQQSNTK